MTDPRELSQMERVQQMLLAGPVCATTFLAAYISAARSRVSDLKTKRGWSIEAVTCDLGHPHKTRQIMYRVTHQGGCRCTRCLNDIARAIEVGALSRRAAMERVSFGEQEVMFV